MPKNSISAQLSNLQQLVADLEAIEFLSTPSARRATCVPW